MTTEKQVRRRCLEWLKKQSDVYGFGNHATGYQRAGTPDWVGCVGPFVLFIEFKAPGGKPSRRQTAEHEKIRKAGGKIVLTDQLELVQEAVLFLRNKAFQEPIE